jgi:hypothetical protein
LRFGTDGAVVVADVRGNQVAPSDGVVTHVLKVRVPDVDAAFARAIAVRTLSRNSGHTSTASAWVVR